MTLESYIALLRRALEPGVPGRATVLRTTAGGYRLDVERVRVDLLEFDDVTCRAAVAAPECALPLWEYALRSPTAAAGRRAVRGVGGRRRRAHEQVLHGAAVTAAEIALGLHLPERAVPLARRATDIEPLAEQGWQVLIRAELAAGRGRGRARVPHLPGRPAPRPRRRAGPAHAGTVRRGPCGSSPAGRRPARLNPDRVPGRRQGAKARSTAATRSSGEIPAGVPRASSR